MSIVANFQVIHFYVSTIAINAPTVLSDAIYTIGITSYVINVHHANTVVGVDGNMINIV